ncbi:hypothetical protein SERLA73DRAFT_112104 [Serpula lacrymans var. lacrymans S7.3]|uniref:N-acetyltransferase ECO1 n=2 Tax=Serpula lacrymans var. lacrymans TaxID=341189 RepID=F8Q609_SERL3|nr:uncharacterized protein SERLADRAFT_440827 [Serpula lacrymans var. lacrymans S7.9]EGN96047.1 hypothetical protein SERLA73DRAFT_112104 [Serpula lacrymans var. lacrymans S7.3]EGO21569.1 hypothetical protein SERLADRAFT_440827 [Serpula lacrymans var. lacrymans S7.9]
MSVQKQHTYGSRTKVDTLSIAPLKRKQPSDTSLSSSLPFKKRVISKLKTSSNVNVKTRRKTLTQLHFSLETSILRTCSQCDLSYTKGAPDDEELHRLHCARVQRGMEWGREEERDNTACVDEIESGLKLKDGRKGRIVCFRGDVGGKIRSKLSNLLETINLTLSSPPLASPTLQASKIYLFLIPSLTKARREDIVGCVVAQRISTAMAVASKGNTPPNFINSTEKDSPILTQAPQLIAVDTSTGLFCHPTPLPTSLGIPRLFVSSTYRRQGIASHLLSAAAATFIHGYPLDPRKGEVAFTQPTESGYAIMRIWGEGNVRVYEE